MNDSMVDIHFAQILEKEKVSKGLSFEEWSASNFEAMARQDA